MAGKRDKVTRLKVVPTRQRPADLVPEEQRKELVAMLEMLLKDARAGRIFGAAVAAFGVDEAGEGVGYANFELPDFDAPMLFWELTKLNRRFHDAFFAEDDDA